MRIVIFAGLVACGGLILDNVGAAEVYKCTNVTGIPAYQDHPCATGDQESKVHIVNTSPAPAPAAPSDDSPAPPEPVIAPSRMHSPSSAPAMWVCVRPEDGTQYMSRDGISQPRMVPAGVLGIPGKNLAQAYGPGGIGVSAPGVRQVPIDHAPQAAVAGDYVAVQDQCTQASHDQVCGYLNKQYDDVHQKLKRAFKDEQAVLKPQEDQLLKDLDGC